MKKTIFRTLLFIVVLSLLPITACSGNVDISEVVGTYVCEKKGFGGDFTVSLNEDGTFSYYVGPLSSFIGIGKWELDGKTVTLSEDNTPKVSDESVNRKYVFDFDGKDLLFRLGGSFAFSPLELEDKTRFIKKELEETKTAVPEKTRQNVPPTLTVSDENTFIDAVLGTYSWTYSSGGQTVTDSASVANFFTVKDKIPEIVTRPLPLGRKIGNEVRLSFDTEDPNTVSVTSIDMKTSEETEVYSGYDLSFSLKEGTYLYKVKATFGESTAEYGFIGTFNIPNF